MYDPSGSQADKISCCDLAKNKQALFPPSRGRKRKSAHRNKGTDGKLESHLLLDSRLQISRRKRIAEWTNLAMAYNKFFIVVLMFLCDLAVGLADSDVPCYRIEPGTIAGIVCVDVLLTLIIVAVTYQCARFRRDKIERANKVYMNVRANCKS